MTRILAELNNLVELSTTGTRCSYHHAQVYLDRDKLNPANDSNIGYAVVRVPYDGVDNSSHVVSSFGNKSLNISNHSKFSGIEWPMIKYVLEIRQSQIILVIARICLNQIIQKKFLQEKLHRWTLVPVDSLNEGRDSITNLAQVKVSRQTRLEESLVQ